MSDVIRILQVVPNMQQGGIENFIMNIYRNIDRTKIQFDFLVHYREKYTFDDEIERLGGKIYRLSFRNDNNIFKYIKDLKSFFSEHKEYNIVHGHMASLAYIYLGIAKKYGVANRIMHSHGTSHLKNVKGYIKYIAFKFCDLNANIRLACSTEAGKYLFRNKEFKVIPNAIDAAKFKFNTNKRIELRKELNISECKVIGHVGRFNLQKNHDFIIELFYELYTLDKRYRLILIGTGELEEKIKNKVNKLNLNNAVIFLENKNDIYNYYNIFDLFIMPSFFEGLPVVGIEAQANGLRCLFSDKITREVDVTKENQFLTIEDKNKWVKEIIEMPLEENFEEREKRNIWVTQSEFNIKNLAKKMEGIYEDMNIDSK